MAKAAEGKTMEAALEECGACKVNFPIKYCIDCKMKLCGMCTNSHRNIPFTKNHTLNDIKPSSKGTQKSSKAKCAKHPNEMLSYICDTCVELLCTCCKADHSGHKLLQLTDDPKSYYKVCTNHIQHLLDDLREVETMKAVLEGHITTYDEAVTAVDQWEFDLLTLIKNKSAKLRQEIQALKDKKISLLSDQMSGLGAKIEEINKSITKLSDVLKSTDPQILSNELAKSQALLAKLESYKHELKPLGPAVSVDKILPNGGKIKDVASELDVMFDFIDFASISTYKGRKQPVAWWIFTKENAGKDHSVHGQNPVTMEGVSYGPGPNGEVNGSVIFPTSKNQSMIVVNPSSELRFTSEMTYFTHVYFEGARGPMLMYFKDQHYGCCFWIQSSPTSLSVKNIGFSSKFANDLTCYTWHRIAVVFKKNNVLLYVDGKLVKSEKQEVDLSTTQKGDIYMGWYPRENLILRGRVASAMFFDEALPEQEIQNLR